MDRTLKYLISFSALVASVLRRSALGSAPDRRQYRGPRRGCPGQSTPVAEGWYHDGNNRHLVRHRMVGDIGRSDFLSKRIERQ